MYKLILLSAICLFTTLLTACNEQANNSQGNSNSDNIVWTDEQLAKNIALQPIASDGDESKFYIRLQGSEQPHYHDDHDLTVEVLTGTAVIHFKESSQSVKAGDTIVIKKGTYHWAENTGAEASVVIGTFTPKLQGKDFRLAE